MNSHYDEDTINQDIAQDQYYTIRDAITSVRKAEVPLSMRGLAYGISDEMTIKELTELVAIIDNIILEKIDISSSSRARIETDKAIDLLIERKAQARV